MPMIRYVQNDGQELAVDVPLGSSVMQGAVDNMLDGIVAECGGACSCATCLVHIDQTWMAKVGEACDMEKEMIQATRELCSNSRLSCQIEVTEDLDGLVVHLLAEQH